MEGQRRGFILVFLVSFLLTQVLCQKTPSSAQVTCPAGHLKSWTHNKPGDWGRLCPAYSQCATGNRQSPINIVRGPAVIDWGLTVKLGWSPVNLIRVDKYVTMPIAFGTGYPTPENTLIIDGRHYYLTRLEFHSPSEHTINGKHANLEVQLYFSTADHQPTAQTAIALLFNRGVCSDDPFFSALIPALPRRDRCECGNNRTENFFPFNEQCDLGAANAYTADKCRPNCVLPFCGDGVKDSGEECDIGNVTKVEPSKCRPGCITPKCGDGVLDSAAPYFEECDDGNRLELDGCSGACKKECGDGCLGPLEECDLGKLNSNISGVFVPAKNVCRTDCRWARCGDGIVDQGEACDDGVNTNLPNGCRANCTLPTCGDNVVDSKFNETCDPPNTATCNANCRFRCGDGVLERPAEECDNGTLNSNASGACRPDCKLPFCGDGIVDPNEQCDFLNNPLCFNNCTWRCGNRQIDSGEQCDNGHPGVYPARANDGNSDTRPNACRMNCQLYSCGDGVVDNLGCEQCDNGKANNDTAPDACRSTCKKASCGDGVVDSGEECDDKNNIDDDGCSCCRKDCGNGVKQGNEDCDDGAANSDVVPDRCRSNCKRHFCGDGLTDSDEECDWANKKSIGCTRECTRPFCGDGITHFTLGEECDAGVNNSYTKINGCSPICTLNVCGQTLTNRRVNLQPLVQGLRYYTYFGSETRPPCTQNVQWFVGSTIRTISNAQFIQFTDVIFKNNRPLQGLNGRSLLGLDSRTFDYPARDPRATPICGNGYVEVTEQCDDGADNSNVVPNACRSDCRASRCGDGVVDAGEECDGQAFCTTGCKINRKTLPATRPQPTVCLSTELQHPIRLPASCPRSRALNLNTPANVHYNPTPLVLFNTGEQLVFPVLNGGTFNFKGISYALQRITFVSPSEHYIGNKQYAFEAQLHHQSQDPFNPKSAIVSVLFDVGTSPNAFLQSVLNYLPTSCGFQCGNGIKEMRAFPDGRLGMEECDSGIQNSDTIPNRCRTNCRNPHCGDGVIDSKEFCDQGVLNANLPNKCRTNCVHPYCGDGIVDTLFGEECDDGNNKNGDGCSSICRNECGNGVVDPNELCDDGLLNSNTNSDACRLNCLLPKCGDNVIDYGEECDSGALNSDTRADACRTNCSRPLCGDGVTDPSLGEECDGGVGCDRNCRKLCGNGKLESGELCDDGAGNSDSLPNACRTDCTTARCGDSVVDAGEECDDGPLNTVRCKGCKIACGNGILESGEECDEGSCNSDHLANGCRTSCRKSWCGDGIRDDKEECDAGPNNKNAPDTCRLNCKKPVCGDGILDQGEACDDGNRIDGDKCSSICQRECGNGRLDPGEACDNGPDNSDSLRGCCRTNCQLPVCGDGVIDDGEECDDGALNAYGPNACRPNCKLPSCGDSIVDHLFGELCDQGTRNGPFVVDGCSPTCLPNAACQSLNMSLSLNPQSLLPTTAGTYWYPISGSFPACNQPGDVFVFAAPQSITKSQLTQFAVSNLIGKGKCLQPRNGRNVEFFEVTTVCGDGMVEGEEECDDGPLNSDFAPNACRRTCRRAFCGDGVQDKNEQCDGTPNCGKDCKLSCPTAASLCSTTNTAACPNQSSSSNPTSTSVLTNQGTIINVNFESILAQ